MRGCRHRRAAIGASAAPAALLALSVAACAGPIHRSIAGRTVAALEDEWSRFDEANRRTGDYGSPRERCLNAISVAQHSNSVAATETARIPGRLALLLSELHCREYSAQLELQAESLAAEVAALEREQSELVDAAAEWIAVTDRPNRPTAEELQSLRADLTQHLARGSLERSLVTFVPRQLEFVTELLDAKAALQAGTTQLANQLRAEAERLEQEERECLAHHEALLVQRERRAQCDAFHAAWERENEAAFETLVAAARPLAPYEFVDGWFGRDTTFEGLSEFEQRRLHKQLEGFRASALGESFVSVTWIRPPTYSFDKAAFLVPYPAVVESGYCHDDDRYGNASAWLAGLPVRPGPPTEYYDSICPDLGQRGPACDATVVTTFKPPSSVTAAHGAGADVAWSKPRNNKTLIIKLDAADAEQVREATGLIQVAVWRPMGEWQTTVLRRPISGRPYYFAKVCGVQAEVAAVQIRHPISGLVLWSSIEPARKWLSPADCSAPPILKTARSNLLAAGLDMGRQTPPLDEPAREKANHGGGEKADIAARALRHCESASAAAERFDLVLKRTVKGASPTPPHRPTTH